MPRWFEAAAFRVDGFLEKYIFQKSVDQFGVARRRREVSAAVRLGKNIFSFRLRPRCSGVIGKRIFDVAAEI